MFSLAYGTALLSAAAILLIYRLVVARKESASRRPPGPAPLPIVGNIHQLASDHIPGLFLQWEKTYGDVVYARLFRTPALILNSLEAAQETMEKRSAKYSSRAHSVLHVDLMGMDRALTHLPYGERFRRHRKWVHDAFEDKNMLDGYRPLQQREVAVLLSGLAETPLQFSVHVRRFAAALIMEIAYGHHVDSMDDVFIVKVEKAFAAIVEGSTPKGMIVDFFPFLRYLPNWFPGAGFKNDAERARVLIKDLLDAPYNLVRSSMAAGTASPSFMASLLEETMNRGGPTHEEERDFKGVGGVLYGAGADTTVTVLLTFFMAMVLNPHVYEKAQAEMDRVVGNGRLPDYNDWDSLPYLECIIKELYRWNPPVPLAIPHQLTVDDNFRGYDIPGETSVIPNIWGMLHQPHHYPLPEEFRPERFETMDEPTLLLRDSRNAVFGFGRRICPGRHFADNSIWLAVAGVVATLDIGQARDAAGAVIEFVPEFDPGLISHPKPFPCEIRPRSQDVLNVIAQAVVNTSA